MALNLIMTYHSRQQGDARYPGTRRKITGHNTRASRSGVKPQSTRHPLEVKDFNLKPGRVLARKYEVISILGSGWEGQVYLVCELATRIEP